MRYKNFIRSMILGALAVLTITVLCSLILKDGEQQKHTENQQVAMNTLRKPGTVALFKPLTPIAYLNERENSKIKRTPTSLSQSKPGYDNTTTTESNSSLNSTEINNGNVETSTKVKDSLTLIKEAHEKRRINKQRYLLLKADAIFKP